MRHSLKVSAQGTVHLLRGKQIWGGGGGGGKGETDSMLKRKNLEGYGENFIKRNLKYK